MDDRPYEDFKIEVVPLQTKLFWELGIILIIFWHFTSENYATYTGWDQRISGVRLGATDISKGDTSLVSCRQV